MSYVIVRVLNTGPAALREQMLQYYGADKVRSVAQARVDRLEAPVYRLWKSRLQLPERPRRRRADSSPVDTVDSREDR